MRHGIAEEGHPGQPDSERALTPEGIKKLRQSLKLARDAGVAPTLILTSPYRRALETADLAREILGCEEELVKTNVLIPSARPEAVWDELKLYRSEPQVLLAGHDPLFSNLTGYLLHCPSLLIDFKKGAMVCVELERFSGEPRGVLKWMLAPRLAG